MTGPLCSSKCPFAASAGGGMARASASLTDCAVAAPSTAAAVRSDFDGKSAVGARALPESVFPEVDGAAAASLPARGLSMLFGSAVGVRSGLCLLRFGLTNGLALRLVLGLLCDGGALSFCPRVSPRFACDPDPLRTSCGDFFHAPKYLHVRIHRYHTGEGRTKRQTLRACRRVSPKPASAHGGGRTDDRLGVSLVSSSASRPPPRSRDTTAMPPATETEPAHSPL